MAAVPGGPCQYSGSPCAPHQGPAGSSPGEHFSAALVDIEGNTVLHLYSQQDLGCGDHGASHIQNVSAAGPAGDPVRSALFCNERKSTAPDYTQQPKTSTFPRLLTAFLECRSGRRQRGTDGERFRQASTWELNSRAGRSLRQTAEKPASSVMPVVHKGNR